MEVVWMCRAVSTDRKDRKTAEENVSRNVFYKWQFFFITFMH